VLPILFFSAWKRNLVYLLVFMKKNSPLFSREGDRGRVFCPRKKKM
jgi:hypothetical protein